MDLNDIIMEYGVRSETDSLNKYRFLNEVQAAMMKAGEALYCKDHRCAHDFCFSGLSDTLRRLAGESLDRLYPKQTQ